MFKRKSALLPGGGNLFLCVLLLPTMLLMATQAAQADPVPMTGAWKFKFEVYLTDGVSDPSGKKEEKPDKKDKEEEKPIKKDPPANSPDPAANLKTNTAYYERWYRFVGQFGGVIKADLTSHV